MITVICIPFTDFNYYIICLTPRAFEQLFSTTSLLPATSALMWIFLSWSGASRASSVITLHLDIYFVVGKKEEGFTSVRPAWKRLKMELPAETFDPPPLTLCYLSHQRHLSGNKLSTFPHRKHYPWRISGLGAEQGGQVGWTKRGAAVVSRRKKAS